MASLDVELSSTQLQVLDKVSALEPAHPYAGLTPGVKRSIFGGTDVQK